MAERTQVDISVSSIFRIIFVVVGVILIYLLSDVVQILLLSVVIASAVQPFVNWFQKKGGPRLLGVILLYLLFLTLVAGLSSLILPSVLAELSNLATYLPKITQQISSSLDTVQSGAPKYFDFVAELQNILEVLSGYLQQFSQSTLDLAVSTFGGLFSFIAVLVLSFYLSAMKDGVPNFLAAIAPERYEEYIIDLWRRVEMKVGYWLQGQLLLALIVALLVYVGLSMFGVKFALVFAVLAMVLEIFPVAGPVLAAMPAIAMAFLQSPTLGFWVFVMWVVIQQVENHILVPIVLGKSTGLNPVVVMLSILIGWKLSGIVGALLGVPVASVIVEIVDDMARLKTSRRAS